MAKQILVKTPMTENGRDIMTGEDGRQLFTESILLDVPGEHGARRILEKRNAGLPKVLQCIISDYVEPAPVKATTADPIKVSETANAPTASLPLLDQFKLQAENDQLKAQIEALQVKQPAKQQPAKPAAATA